MTDAVAVMGLESGIHKLGTLMVEMKGTAVRLSGVQTLAGRYGGVYL